MLRDETSGNGLVLYFLCGWSLWLRVCLVKQIIVDAGLPQLLVRCRTQDMSICQLQRSIKELPSSCTLTKGKELLKLTTIQTRRERSCVPRFCLGYAADWCGLCLLFEHSTSLLEMPTCWNQRSLKYFFVYVFHLGLIVAG